MARMAKSGSLHFGWAGSDPLPAARAFWWWPGHQQIHAKKRL